MIIRHLMSAGIVFFSAAGFGWSWANHGRQFNVMVYSANRREPASIGREFDFSKLEGSALIKASKERLLNDLHVIRAHSAIGLQLGHFAMLGDDHQRQFACDYYDRIELSFRAEGMATNGKAPTMNVDSPCEISTEVHLISPVWIPVDEILKRNPGDKTLSFEKFRKLKISFQGISFMWPKDWALIAVRLYNQNRPDRELHFSDFEVGDTAFIIQF